MVDSLRDCEFRGHGSHVLAREAPAVVENVLTPQLTQALAAVAPGVVRYLPAGQSMQFDREEYCPASQSSQLPIYSTLKLMPMPPFISSIFKISLGVYAP
jgi:hypothetical protein